MFRCLAFIAFAALLTGCEDIDEIVVVGLQTAANPPRPPSA